MPTRRLNRKRYKGVGRPRRADYDTIKWISELGKTPTVDHPIETTPRLVRHKPQNNKKIIVKNRKSEGVFGFLRKFFALFMMVLIFVSATISYALTL